MVDIIKTTQFLWRCMQHKDEIKYLLTRLEPYAVSIKKDFPELAPRVQKLIKALFPETPPATEPHYDVHWIQESLNALGYGPLAVDGIYGSHTVDAIKEFQRQHGIPVNGWAGVPTCVALDLELKHKK